MWGREQLMCWIPTGVFNLRYFCWQVETRVCVEVHTSSIYTSILLHLCNTLKNTLTQLTLNSTFLRCFYAGLREERTNSLRMCLFNTRCPYTYGIMQITQDCKHAHTFLDRNILFLKHGCLHLHTVTSAKNCTQTSPLSLTISFELIQKLLELHLIIST